MKEPTPTGQANDPPYTKHQYEDGICTKDEKAVGAFSTKKCITDPLGENDSPRAEANTDPKDKVYSKNIAGAKTASALMGPSVLKRMLTTMLNFDS